MITKEETVINELKLRIKLLEKQNEQMAEGMDEKLLLWLVTEIIVQADNKDELLHQILERISVIRDVPLSFCCSFENTNYKIISSYPSKDITDTDDCLFSLSENLIEKLNNGPFFISGNEMVKEDFKMNADLNIKPDIISIFPFHCRPIPFGFIVFIETEHNNKNIKSFESILSRILTIATDKINLLSLVEEKLKPESETYIKIREENLELSHFNKQLRKEIRERKQKEKELKKEKENIEKNEELKTTLLNNISQEVRTPLTGILGFSDLLRRNDLSLAERSKYINIIRTSGRSVLKIIDDVLDLGRIETKDIELNPEEFPVTHFLNELYNSYKEDDFYKQKEKNLDLRLNVNVSSNTIIRTDKNRLKQVLDNLIGNALKFTEEGYVEIGCRVKEKDFTDNGWKDLLFFVKDSGIGIPTKLQDAVFEKFMKIEYDISKLYGGTGLGLTIAKKIVEKLGGKIWLNSSLGEGTEFYFTMPESVYIPAKQEPSLTTIELKGKYKWNGKTVLVVEDDEMSMIFLREILKPTKINILHAANGYEAIKIIREHPEIDLVLMDIKLPEMDGFEATKEIRKSRKELPIIAQTAYAMADDKKKSMEVGCSDYITKPVNRKLLLKTVDKFLNL